MKKEIIVHVKILKEQGTDIKVDEIDKFLKDYGDKNINISYGDKGDKNKFDTENITKSLKKIT